MLAPFQYVNAVFNSEQKKKNPLFVWGWDKKRCPSQASLVGPNGDPLDGFTCPILTLIWAPMTGFLASGLQTTKQRSRPACASMQTDQLLCYSLFDM